MNRLAAEFLTIQRSMRGWERASRKCSERVVGRYEEGSVGRCIGAAIGLVLLLSSPSLSQTTRSESGLTSCVTESVHEAP